MVSFFFENILKVNFSLVKIGTGLIRKIFTELKDNRSQYYTNSCIDS